MSIDNNFVEAKIYEVFYTVLQERLTSYLNQRFRFVLG